MSCLQPESISNKIESKKYVIHIVSYHGECIQKLIFLQTVQIQNFFNTINYLSFPKNLIRNNVSISWGISGRISGCGQLFFL